MPSMFPTILEHMKATDTLPIDMVRILCEYISAIDAGDQPGPHMTNEDSLIDFVQENLERGPGDVPIPPWRLPMFTETDRTLILQQVMDEVADSSFKDLAKRQLDEDEDLVSTIGYAVPPPFDVEEICRMLSHIGNTEEAYLCGAFLRDHDDDGDDYAGQLDWAKRMGLINEDETAVTDRGREFISRFE